MSSHDVVGCGALCGRRAQSMTGPPRSDKGRGSGLSDERADDARHVSPTRRVWNVEVNPVTDEKALIEKVLPVRTGEHSVLW